MTDPPDDDGPSVRRVWSSALFVGVLIAVVAGALKLSLPGLAPERLRVDGTVLMNVNAGAVIALDPQKRLPSRSIYLDPPANVDPFNDAAWWDRGTRRLIVPSEVSSDQRVRQTFSFDAYGLLHRRLAAPATPQAQWVVASSGGQLALTGSTSGTSATATKLQDASGRWHAVAAAETVGRPAWNPAGDELATSCTLSGRGAYRLCLFGASGRLITSYGPKWLGSLIDPEFSSNGHEIVLVGQARDGSQSDIYTLSPAHPKLRRITDDGRDKGSPEWSPHGDALAFVAGDKVVLHDLVTSSETTLLSPIAPGSVESLQWTSTAPTQFGP